MKKLLDNRKAPNDKSFSEPMHIKKVAWEKRAHEIDEDNKDKLEKAKQFRMIIY